MDTCLPFISKHNTRGITLPAFAAVQVHQRQIVVPDVAGIERDDVVVAGFAHQCGPVAE